MTKRPSLKNNFQAVRFSLWLFFHKPQNCFFYFLMLTFNLLVTTAGFYLLYLKHGIHIFDYKTLSDLLNLNLIDHLQLNIAILFIFLMVSCIIIYIHFCIVYYNLQERKGNVCTLLHTMLIVLSRYSSIIKFSSIIFIQHILRVLNTISPAEQMYNLQAWFFGECPPYRNEERLEQIEYFIFPSLLIENPKKTMLEILKQSASLVKKKLGLKAELQFFLFPTKILFFFPVLIFATSILYIYFDHLAVVIFSIIIFLICSSAITCSKLMLKVLLYCFCKGYHIWPLSKQECLALFTRK